MSPSKKLTRNLLACLLVSQLCRLLVVALAPSDYQWQLHDVCMHATTCLGVTLLYEVMPYRKVALKCLILVWLGFEIVPFFESVMNVYILKPRPYQMVLQCASAAALSIWCAVRSYKNVSDELDEYHLFICRLKPRGLQDLFLAFMPSGLGGVAVYWKDNFWHYKNGVLVNSEFTHRSRYVITKAGIPDEEIIQQLDGLVGQKWTLHKNCLTTLYAITKIGRPIFPLISSRTRSTR